VDAAGQVGVGAQAAHVEVVAQVGRQVDRQRHRLALRRGASFGRAAQHDHVVGQGRAVLRREFDQRAVGLEACLRRRSGVASRTTLAWPLTITVRSGTRQRFQLVGHQAQVHRGLAAGEAHVAVDMARPLLPSRDRRCSCSWSPASVARSWPLRRRTPWSGQRTARRRR
jgi:hypothetical protein